MTQTTNARIAGAAFLLYIGAGITGMAGRWPSPVTIALSFTECFCAFLLAVTLNGLTRDVDRDVAMFGLVCRVAEGILGAMFISATDGHREPSLNVGVGATFFAAGSLAFCSLLLRGRLIPTALAWIGVLASIQLLVMLPLQLAGSLPPSLAAIMWLPMLAFEVPVALWFLTSGVAEAPHIRHEP